MDQTCFYRSGRQPSIIGRCPTSITATLFPQTREASQPGRGIADHNGALPQIWQVQYMLPLVKPLEGDTITKQ